MRISLPTLATLLLALAAPLAAQEPAPEPTPVDSLSRVRVSQRSAAPARVTGVLLAADSQSLTVRSLYGERVTVPLTQLNRLHVSRGQLTRGQGALRGAKYGLIGGALFSAAVTGLVIALDESASCSDNYCAEIGLILGSQFTAATTAGGALLGTVFRGERWERVRPPVVLTPPSTPDGAVTGP